MDTGQPERHQIRIPEDLEQRLASLSVREREMLNEFLDQVRLLADECGLNDPVWHRLRDSDDLLTVPLRTCVLHFELVPETRSIVLTRIVARSFGVAV